MQNILSLKIKKKLNFEIIHFYEDRGETLIASKGNNFFLKKSTEEIKIKIPVGFISSLLLFFRTTRRLFRLDKSNAFFSYDKKFILILYRGNIWRFCLTSKSLVKVFKFTSRNVLHGGIAVTKSGIYLGDYSRNKNRNEIYIYRSLDSGLTWKIIYEFPKNSIRHVHGVFFDSFINKLWVLTGDEDSECFLISANFDFSEVEKMGNGSQKWRATDLIFTEDKIIWGMDSPNENSYLQFYDRSSKTLERGTKFPGPIWFTKRLEDGFFMVQTTVEKGVGVKSNFCKIFVSKDLHIWNEVASFKKDFLPMPYFKWGVIFFSKGKQFSDNFTFSNEALSGIDGKSFIAKLEINNKNQ